jgi:lipopolysaccharide transport system permease protein
VARVAKKSNSIEFALRDVANGTVLWPLWVTLGWNDIRQRYRRSLLGPLWLTASMAIMVVSLGLIYARIYKTEIDNFLPFLSVGLLVWGFMSSTLVEAGTLFIGSESYIKQVRLPFFLYVYRFVWSRLIIFAHNFVIYLCVLIYFRISPGMVALEAIPGMLIVSLNALLVSLYLGMISARFRDIPQIVASFVQIVFFITPIMWKPEFFGARSYMILANPFFHLIEVVRAPLLGLAPTLQNCAAVAIVTLVNLLIASCFFVKYRSRIAYWV